jgi:hypothetical protein
MGSGVPQLQARGQKASAEDRFLWDMQWRVVQPSVSTALADRPVIKVSSSTSRQVRSERLNPLYNSKRGQRGIDLRPAHRFL